MKSIRGLLNSMVFATAVGMGAVAEARALCPTADGSESCPYVLHVAPGTYGALANSAITKTNYVVNYALAVHAGQTITVSFAGTHDMRGSITCGNDGDGPWYGTGNSFTTKTSGTCIIRVAANTHSGDPWDGGFTLAVIVR
jgi:hypothetical protein